MSIVTEKLTEIPIVTENIVTENPSHEDIITENLPENLPEVEIIPAIRDPQKVQWITIPIDRDVHERLIKMAKSDGCTIRILAAEAIATWVRWLGEAEDENIESEIQNMKEAEKRTLEIKAYELWRGYRKRLGISNRKTWARYHPGKPWPYAPGIKK